METIGTINPQQEPIIGSSILLHETSRINGQLFRPFAGGLLETAARHGRSPWEIALQNDLGHPYSPLLYAPIFLPGGNEPPRDMPNGFEALSISTNPAKPGQALAVQARSQPGLEAQISLEGNLWNTFRNGDRLLALGATGAFFGAGMSELRIQVEHHPLWAQPLLFENKDWYYDQVTFAATAANEQEAIQIERERLQQIWEQVTTEPLWSSTFTWPLLEYVELTSHYGARRSVNGGAYDTYHEGTDFSAYHGTPVYASAGGRVALAESLIVRGGAVILDHGLGIHTGYYHLSDIKVNPGDEVEAGDLIGEVGTTGRSTGNHLHWDLLIGTTWVDAEAWMDSNLGSWIRNAWGGPFPNLDLLDMPSNY
jgi:murein DD-endopeptidase MepM/ murein hydrolase activator NlpD